MWQASYLVMKLLTTHSTSRTGYYFCLFIQAQFQLVASYIHACTNETHSIANLQDLIPTYFGSNNYRQDKLAKVEVKSCRFELL